jgi:intracellular septation protein A
MVSAWAQTKGKTKMMKILWEFSSFTALIGAGILLANDHFLVAMTVCILAGICSSFYNEELKKELIKEILKRQMKLDEERCIFWKNSE